MSSVIGFEEQIGVRIKSSDRNKIKRIVAKHQDLYYNESHFIRCAVLREIRRYER